MIKTTHLQKKCLRDLAVCKVKYKNIWRTRHELGYTVRNNRHYDIVVAGDTGRWDVSDIVLIHEVGHVWLGHCDVKILEELRDIKKRLEDKGLSFKSLRYYGGPRHFINICVDLEVNSSILTKGNIQAMKDFGVESVTLDSMEVELAKDFRGYYDQLIDKLKDYIEKNNLPVDAEDQTKTMPGIGADGVGRSLQDLMDDSDIQEAINEALIEQEILDELEKEPYKTGNTKESLTRNYSATESSVEDEEADMGMDDSERDKSTEEKKKEQANISSKKGIKGIGKTPETSAEIEVYDNDVKTIKRFLASIIHSTLSYQHDAMKHYNRGTRYNTDGIFYNSIRRKVDRKRKKLGILIDVSGSMDTGSIVGAVSSLKTSLNVVDPASELVTWNTHLSERYKITQIPEKVRIGGGTDIAAGLGYLAENRFTDIVIYSDFETDLTDLNQVRESFPTVKIYSIVVGGSYVSSYDKKWESFVQGCTRIIKVV